MGEELGGIDRNSSVTAQRCAGAAGAVPESSALFADREERSAGSSGVFCLFFRPLLKCI